MFILILQLFKPFIFVFYLGIYSHTSTPICWWKLSILISAHRDPNHLAWNRCNNLIYSWICCNSMSPQLVQSIVFIEDVLNVWKELKECFSKSDRIWVAKLQSILTNYNKDLYLLPIISLSLKILWDVVESFVYYIILHFPSSVSMKHRHKHVDGTPLIRGVLMFIYVQCKKISFKWSSDLILQ